MVPSGTGDAVAGGSVEVQAGASAEAATSAFRSVIASIADRVSGSAGVSRTRDRGRGEAPRARSRSRGRRSCPDGRAGALPPRLGARAASASGTAALAASRSASCCFGVSESKTFLPAKITSGRGQRFTLAPRYFAFSLYRFPQIAPRCCSVASRPLEGLPRAAPRGWRREPGTSERRARSPPLR